MELDRAREMIQAAKRILLTTHVRPDGDAVGSIVALQRIIDQQAQSEGRECQTQLLLLSESPATCRFLLDHSYWVRDRDINEEQVAAGKLDEFDLVIVADTCTVKQLPMVGPYLLQRRGQTLVFDHHLSRDDIGTCRIIDTSSAATGQMIVVAAQHWGWPIDEHAAVALYTAICTDTGWFRFENTAPETFRAAADLVAAGASPPKLHRQLFENFPIARLKLLLQVLNGMELYCHDRLAVLQVTESMFIETGADPTHIENMVNEPYQVDSVLISVLLTERGESETRVSFRSRNALDVNQVARQFGGGGHARAAGATIEKPIDQAREDVLDALKAAIQCEEGTRH